MSERERRTFVLRAVVLLALTGVVTWASWLAPWSRASARVVVQAADRAQ